MASARSTVSMARTTPAQKPRGEQSTILRSGLAEIFADMGQSRDRITPRRRAGNGRSEYDLGPLSGAVKALSEEPLCRCPPMAYIGRNSVIADDHRLRLQRGGRSTKEICHEQRASDAQGDRRLAAG